MSSESQKESVSEQLSAAEETLCEGTIVQNEEELCRQRRLLDMTWNPQLQLHLIVLPKYYVTEEDFCNQQRNFRGQQEEPELSQIKEKQDESEPSRMKKEQEELEPPEIKEEQEESEPPHMKKEQEEPEPSQIKEEQEESEPPHIKEETEELCISQDEEQFELKQETDASIEIPTYEKNEKSEANLNKQQSFNVTASQDEKPTSTTSEEIDQKIQRDFKECGKSFDFSQFRFHERIHEKCKPLAYEKCAKGFIKLIILKSQTHTVKNPFYCKECDTSFSQMSNLKRHMKIHTGEKPFSCKQCEKSFNRKSVLKTHMRTHTGEKPYSCKECNTSFSQTCNLKRHMRIHTGEKPYSCI